MYTRAFSTLGCGEMALDEVFGLADRHAIAGVELRVLAGTLDLPAYFAQTFGSPELMAAKVGSRGPRIVALDTSFRLTDAGAKDRAQLLAFAPWADALGVRWLRVFDGAPAAGQVAVGAAADTLNWWHSVQRQKGFRAELMIETHDLLLDSTIIRGFAAAIAPCRMHLLWDAHHTWKRGGEDPLVTWQAIRDQVAHVHVKDSLQKSPAGTAVPYALPGTGDFPMAPLRAVLAKEFTGAVSLEWERQWHPALPPLDDALRAAADCRWW